MSEIKHLVGKV